MNSMTGYGRARGEDGITVEIRAVNARYLDIVTRAPRTMLYAEEPMKAVVAKSVQRGKIEILLSVDRDTSREPSVTVCDAVAGRYVALAREMGDRFGLPDDLSVSTLFRLPEVIVSARDEPDESALVERVRALTREALAAFCAMRRAEGTHIREDLLRKADIVERLVDALEARSPESVAAYKTKLLAKLHEVLENRSVDESRVLTEAALFADKVCVDEETVRLRSHIAALRELLMADGAVGRKLDFLAQEFAREASTIGAKATDGEMSRLVLELKTEIEKIREQVQNIE